jgi:tetratricopeptide (TPR) repeat protein
LKKVKKNKKKAVIMFVYKRQNCSKENIKKMNKRTALAEFCDTNNRVEYFGNSIDDIMSTAITLIWNRNFNEALLILNKEKEKEPQNIYIEKYLGIAKESLKKIPEAIKHYNEAIKLAKMEDEELYDSFIQEIIGRIKHLNF